MLNLEQAREIGKRVATTQYKQVEADAFMLGYFLALQDISGSKGLDGLEKNYKQACEIVNAAQQSVHLTGGTLPPANIDQHPEVDLAGEDNQRPATSR